MLIQKIIETAYIHWPLVCGTFLYIAEGAVCITQRKPWDAGMWWAYALANVMFFGKYVNQRITGVTCDV